MKMAPNVTTTFIMLFSKKYEPTINVVLLSCKALPLKKQQQINKFMFSWKTVKFPSYPKLLNGNIITE